MITLWHCVDARSFRALWALEEVGQPYRLEILPFPPRYLAREYLAINPLGTIPLMIDGETRMTESAAICQYLAERYAGPPLAVRPDEPGYGAYLNALHFGEATLTFPQTIVLRYGRLERPERRLPQAVADYARWTLGRLKGLDSVMGGADYVAAERFTVADISDRLRDHDAQGRQAVRSGAGVAARLLRAPQEATRLHAGESGAKRRRQREGPWAAAPAGRGGERNLKSRLAFQRRRQEREDG